MKTYKIGTRGSLLAVTQSTLIMEQLEEIVRKKSLSNHSSQQSVGFELVKIKTQGDQITDKPLWQLDGKDFFTKELDQALLNGEVDLVVHSYKDLGSERPKGIKLAAITERKFPHDILLIPQAIVEKLQHGKWHEPLIVGTSSPRRITNLQSHLSSFIPHHPRIECLTLRGNVNSRIQKLREGKYHAIVLALAGLERLCGLEQSLNEISKLLEGMNYFILPQSVFPTAASQGALGIEMNENREDLEELFQFVDELNHQDTIDEIKRERKSFQEYGGGCHLAVGINVRKISPTHYLHQHKGKVQETIIAKKWLEDLSCEKTSAHLPSQHVFVGLPSGNHPYTLYDELMEKVVVSKKFETKNQHLFITSRYCIPSLLESPSPEGIWSAGIKTAQELVRNHFWINGTSDSLGARELTHFKESKVLKLMHQHLPSHWLTLTHSDKSNRNDEMSDLGPQCGCYHRQVKNLTNEEKINLESKLRTITSFYWTSFPQYEIYTQYFPFIKSKNHFCGLGKTWQEFQLKNIEVTAVCKMEDFFKLSGASEGSEV